MRGIEQFLQVDAATLGALKYAGTWNASTNTPTLASGVGVQGQYYVVSVAGSTNLDGETNWGVGDWAVFNGSVWQKVDGGSTGLLTTLTVTGNTYLATTSGDVGIGTSSPAAKLDVVGSLGIRVNEDGAGTKVIQIRSNYAGLGPSVQVSTADPLLFLTSNAERMRITSAGDVGIGTSSPDAKLRVNGAAKIGEGAASNTSKLMVNTVSGVAAGIQLFQDANESWIIQNPASTTALTFANSGTERMRITSTGDVGIGTSSPGVKLDIRGSAVGSNFAAISVDNTAGGSGSPANTVSINFSNGGAVKDSITGAVYGDGYLAFATNNNTEKMRLDASGNLGLGVTPSGWATVGPVFQANQASITGYNNQAIFSANWYYNAGNKYITTGYATQYSQSSGSHAWYTAPSGTAGNAISFTQAMTLDASGNLGLGVTPSASTIAQFEGGSNLILVGRGNVYASNNATFNSGWKYISTAVAAQYNISNAEHRWLNAASGTAGDAITFTQAMTLDASGNLLVGTTSNPGVLNTSVVINSGANSLAGLVLQNNATGSSSTDGSHITIVGTELRIVNSENAPTLFLNNGAERARIPAAGGMVVGTAALATNATDGFLYVPTCAGTPTGTPTTQTGTAPIVIDTTNNKLYFYSGGQWRDAGP